MKDKSKEGKNLQKLEVQGASEQGEKLHHPETHFGRCKGHFLQEIFRNKMLLARNFQNFPTLASRPHPPKHKQYKKSKPRLWLSVSVFVPEGRPLGRIPKNTNSARRVSHDRGEVLVPLSQKGGTLP